MCEVRLVSTDSEGLWTNQS